ncbi:MAG: preprotein translocase subunit SecE [bacterium]|jgi:preprotein translocase subunit SecE|nr:preprotein translocase subunit SecE [bacterium]
MSTSVKKKVNPIKWLALYINESREEMKKVSWPSRKETMKYSVIVIALSLVIAGFFGGLDWILNQGLEWLISITA